MIVMPDIEKDRFETLVQGEARRFGIGPREYLQKVWCHEEAARLGEYVAMVLMNELLQSLSLGDDVAYQSST